MLEIGLGLIKGGNGELLRCATATKTGDLRKDKPDPVTGFLSGSQLSKDGVVDALLRVEKAVEIVNVSHGLVL